MDEGKSTLERIHQAGKAEFLKKGFKSASLRNIVKTAGVTTGAFYGYYNSKEELFKALVDTQYQTFFRMYCQSQEDFASLPQEEQPENLSRISGLCMFDMLHYAYENLDEFKLILCCSEGTRYAGLMDEMTRVEARGTHDYYRVLEILGRPSPPIDPQLEHILITGMFNTFFELIIHEMPIKKAEAYLAQMRDFYTAGWMKIMGQDSIFL